MINIDIQNGKSIVYGTYSDISISRIGDVVFFEKNNKNQCRSPWDRIFSADSIECMGGSLLGREVDIIRFFSKDDFELDILIKIFKNKKMNLSILQGEKKYSLCVVKGRFCGNKINLSQAVFDFEVDKSEMFYE